MKVALKEEYFIFLGNKDIVETLNNYHTVLEKDILYELRDCNKVRQYVYETFKIINGEYTIVYEYGEYTVTKEIVDGEYTIDYSYTTNGNTFVKPLKFYSKDEWSNRNKSDEQIIQENINKYLTNPCGINNAQYVRVNYNSERLDLGELGIFTTVCDCVITPIYNKQVNEYHDQSVYPKIRKYLRSKK